MKHLWLCALIAAPLSGCVQFPDLASRDTPPAPAYPAILPLDDLLAQVAVTGPSPGVALAARAAALQARADALRTLP